jgi:phosphoribosyl-ATP pyrophosphohydrolase
MSKPTWAGPFHKTAIPRGVFGEMSKVYEEACEAVDADKQGQQLMLLVECADILGALAGVITNSNVRLEDLAYQKLNVQPASSSLEQKQILQEIARLAQEEYSLENARSIVAYLLDTTLPHQLDYSALERFARLRSQVARYALEN